MAFHFGGEQYFVMGLHLVSQSAKALNGEIFNLPKNPNRKKESANELVGNYVNDILSQNQTPNLILLGDFNDYPWSETLKGVKYQITFDFDSSENFNESYSYIHEGNGFQFDYAAVSKSLAKINIQLLYSSLKIIFLM